MRKWVLGRNETFFSGGQILGQTGPELMRWMKLGSRFQYIVRSDVRAVVLMRRTLRRWESVSLDFKRFLFKFITENSLFTYVH